MGKHKFDQRTRIYDKNGRLIRGKLEKKSGFVSNQDIKKAGEKLSNTLKTPALPEPVKVTPSDKTTIGIMVYGDDKTMHLRSIDNWMLDSLMNNPDVKNHQVVPTKDGREFLTFFFGKDDLAYSMLTKETKATCAYDATTKYLANMFGIQLSHDDIVWYTNHPNVEGSGLQENFTFGVLNELVRPYGLEISEIYVQPGLIWNHGQEWIDVMGMNPISQNNPDFTHDDFVKMLGNNQVEMPYRIRYASSIEGPAVVFDGWSGITATQFNTVLPTGSGGGGGHASYIGPRGKDQGFQYAIKYRRIDGEPNSGPCLNYDLDSQREILFSQCKINDTTIYSLTFKDRPTTPTYSNKYNNGYNNRHSQYDYSDQYYPSNYDDPDSPWNDYEWDHEAGMYVEIKRNTSSYPPPTNKVYYEWLNWGRAITYSDMWNMLPPDESSLLPAQVCIKPERELTDAINKLKGILGHLSDMATEELINTISIDTDYIYEQIEKAPNRTEALIKEDNDVLMNFYSELYDLARTVGMYRSLLDWTTVYNRAQGQMSEMCTLYLLHATIQILKLSSDRESGR